MSITRILNPQAFTAATLAAKMYKQLAPKSVPWEKLPANTTASLTAKAQALLDELVAEGILGE